MIPLFKSQQKTKSLFSTGFTLLETLVAISILTLSIAGAFSVAQSGLSAAIIARDQIIAFHLAQEAIELVRHIRDNNTFNGNTDAPQEGWLTDIPSQCFSTDCAVNIVSKKIEECTDGCKILKNTGSYVQNVSGAAPISNAISTAFTRKVRLKNVITNQTNQEVKEVKISVTMSWRKGSLIKTFVTESHIFNWQKRQ